MPYVGRELTRGSYLKLDTIADQFNGSKTTFDLQSGGSAFYPGSSTSILVSIGGTVQEPVTQYGVDRSQIIFATPPSNGQSFFAVALGVALGTGVPSKHSVGGEELSKPFNYEDGLLYLDSVNNRIGIHTASPSHPFHVVGDMVVDGNIRGNIHNTTGIATFRNIRVDGDLIVDGDTTTLNTTLREVEVLHVDANTTAAAGIITQRGVGDVLQLWDGSTNKQHFVVADNGKVGIGSTAVPTADLEIHGGVENPSLALKRNSGGGDVASIAWHAENASPTKVAQINYRGGAPGPGMQFYTAGGTSSEQRMVIDLEGKVGIGTRIPQKFLELRTTNPTINVKATGGNDASIELIETSNPNFGANGAAGFRIRYDGGDNYLRIASGADTTVNNRVAIARDTGYFGIGLDTPSAQLQVNGTSNGLQARFGGAGTGLGVSCFQKTNNNAGVIFHAQDSSHGTFAFRTAGVEALRIDSSQRVIIGNKSSNGVSELSYYDDLTINNSAEANGAAGGAGITLIAGDNTWCGLNFGRSGDHDEGFVKYDNAGNYMVFGTGNGSEKMRIDSNGLVGINTVNPQQMLDVRGNVVIGIDQVSGNPGNTTGIATIRGHFVNAEGDFARLSFSNSLSASGAATRSSASIRGLRLGDNLGTGLAFWTNPTSGANPGVERLRITEEGKVGINQDTPTAELEVAPVGTGTSSTIFINAPTHNTNVASEAALKFGYGHSGGQAVGYIKLNEGGGNSFDGNLTIGVPYNQGGGNFGTRDAIIIRHSGKVGIGTDDPGSYKTQIETTDQNVLRLVNDSDNADGVELVLQKDSASPADEDNIGNLYFQGNDDSGNATFYSSIEAYSNDVSNNAESGYIRFRTRNAGTMGERLRITSDGKYYFTGTGGGSGSRGLGIETESVGAVDECVILNARASGTTGRLKFQTNSKTAMTIDGDGENVGIGTIVPDNLLHLYKNNSTAWPFHSHNAVPGTYAYTPYPHELQLQNDSRDVANSFTGIYFHAGAAAAGDKMSTARIGAIDTGDYKADIAFGTRDTHFYERMRITAAGDVGINTTSPLTASPTHASTFQVNGDIVQARWNHPGKSTWICDSTNGDDGSEGIITRMNCDLRLATGASNYDAARPSILLKNGGGICINPSTYGSGSDYNNVVVGSESTSDLSKGYKLYVNGSFAATTKSFVIDHPTKENHQLRYACLEGPENSVYVRGRSSDPVIELPDYWVGLVHDDSITVNVTPIGNKNVWVESINNNSVTIGSDDSTEYFYTVFAERKDVEKLEVEVEN